MTIYNLSNDIKVGKKLFSFPKTVAKAQSANKILAKF